MALHLHGTVVTQYGVAANNRGENEGNITTLQKILWKGLNHTTVSSEAIRYSIRLQWQGHFDQTQDSIYETNRTWNPSKGDAGDFEYKDQAFSAVKYIDDDVMGYMDAKAPKSENNDGSSSGKPAKGKTTARRGPLEVSRAVSLHPYNGETTFNARGGNKGSTSLYATEIHATSYQYSFSLTPHELKVKERAAAVVEALSALTAVGGNQGRFLYDFSPALVILRLTHDPAPRILYVAESEGDGADVSVRNLIKRIQSGDIKGEELYVGGELLIEDEEDQLKALGVSVQSGVMRTADEVIQALRRE